MINLQKMKQSLTMSSSNPNVSLINTIKPDTANPKQDNAPPKKIHHKEKNDMLAYFILKEKELSAKILKCSSEKEIMSIFKKKLHKKYAFF